ncbi:hypothetical protein AX774_g5557 [Zancudomyces culisetae]|uniref:Uncharacterized protein n=1 Tax=Zancudomyces culisetae TaxID=1213189 RepID=A0A1R1PJ67_ZANCU|nr:hypothetical protein AX774_g5557 [Zancudomyces culisetae]|eukprot:OMH80997.1 hypothetical protein AX774_g5557 [Zancudomyces culisetae]
MLVGSLSKSAEGSARNILSPVNPKLSDEHKGNKQSFEEIKRMFAKGDANGVYPTGFTDPTRSNLQREQTKTYGSNLKNYTIKSSTTGKHVYDKGVLPTTSLLAGRPSVLYNQIERSLCNSRNYIDTDISTTNDTLLTHRNLHNKPAQDSSTKNNERDIDNTETFSTPNLLTSPKNNDIINDIEFLHQIPTGKDSFSPTINPENDTHSAFCTISSTKKKSRSEHSLSTLEDQKDDVSIISMDRYETSRHLSPDSITNDLGYSHKSSLNTVSVFFKKIIRTLEKFATDYIVLNPYPVPQILSTPPGTEPNHIKTEAVYGAEPLLSFGARDSKSGCITELRWSGNTREEAIAKSMYSDYSQPGMRTCFGILDSDTLTYVYPQLVGTLPQLWLPGKVDSD